MNHKEPDEGQTPCPRCGADAEWSYIDEAGTHVEIKCPDCGRVEMSRADFDQFTAEIGEVNEPETR